MNFNFEKYNVPFDHYIVDNFLPEDIAKSISNNFLLANFFMSIVNCPNNILGLFSSVTYTFLYWLKYLLLSIFVVFRQVYCTCLFFSAFFYLYVCACTFTLITFLELL